MISPEIAEATARGFAGGLTTGLGSAVVIALILWWIWVQYPANVKLVLAQVWSVLSYFFGVFAERYYVVNHIEGKVGKGIENVLSKIDGLDANQVKIVLVRTTTREAFIRDHTLVLYLQKRENHGENLANVAVFYSQHLYSRIDPSLNRLQQEAIRLYTAKNILMNGGKEGLKELEEKFYRPLIAKHPNIQTLFNKLEQMDEGGVFFTVFIQEMVFLGAKASFRPHIRGLSQEVEKFIGFLLQFISRERRSISNMDFRDNNIKVSFILVAARDKRNTEEISSYVYRTEHLPSGVESIYFMGWGENIDFVRKVVAAVKMSEKYLEIGKEKEYKRSFQDGGSVNATCILARNKNIIPLIES